MSDEKPEIKIISSPIVGDHQPLYLKEPFTNGEIKFSWDIIKWLRQNYVGLRHVTGQRELQENMRGFSTGHAWGDAISLSLQYTGAEVGELIWGIGHFEFEFEEDHGLKEDVVKSYDLFLKNFIYQQCVGPDLAYISGNQALSILEGSDKLSEDVIPHYIMMPGYRRAQYTYDIDHGNYQGFGKCGSSNMADPKQWKNTNVQAIALQPNMEEALRIAREEFRRMMEEEDFRNISTFAILKAGLYDYKYMSELAAKASLVFGISESMMRQIARQVGELAQSPQG